MAQYEKIDGSIYELRESMSDGLEEKDRFIDQLYQVTNKEKTDFRLPTLLLRQFAQYLDGREDVVVHEASQQVPCADTCGDYNWTGYCRRR